MPACPYCKKEIEIGDNVQLHMISYGETVHARTKCCGKIAKLIPYTRFDAYETKQVEQDDWGN